MKGVGLKIKCKVMEFISMRMDQFLEVNGKIISNMEEDNMNLQMALFSKVNGKVIKCMEVDFILII